MIDLTKAFKKQEANVLKYLDEYLATEKFQKELKKMVIEEVQECMTDVTLSELLTDKANDNFSRAIEEAIRKRFNF